MKVDIYNTDKKYKIIYTDPPWAQTKGNLRKCRPNQNKSLDYKTMSLDDIKELHKTFLETLVKDHKLQSCMKRHGLARMVIL